MLSPPVFATCPHCSSLPPSRLRTGPEAVWYWSPPPCRAWVGGPGDEGKLRPWKMSRGTRAQVPSPPTPVLSALALSCLLGYPQWCEGAAGGCWEGLRGRRGLGRGPCPCGRPQAPVCASQTHDPEQLLASVLCGQPPFPPTLGLAASYLQGGSFFQKAVPSSPRPGPAPWSRTCQALTTYGCVCFLMVAPTEPWAPSGSRVSQSLSSPARHRINI